MTVRRDALHQFLLRMAIDPAQGGGFTMHEGAQRVCYSVIDVQKCCLLLHRRSLLLGERGCGV